MVIKEQENPEELGVILEASSYQELGQESGQELGQELGQEMAPSPTIEPMPPLGISAAESEAFQAKAATAIQQLESASGGKEMELLDSITSVGSQAQRQAGRELDLLRTRVGDMLARESGGENVSRDLIDLRLTLEKIIPYDPNRSWFRRVMRTLPLVGAFNPLATSLKRIAIRYETVSKQVRVVESSLRDGRMLLTRDNIELRMLYEQVENQQSVILKNAYLGELLVQHLDEALAVCDDSAKSARLRQALHDVIIRVQDLKEMEEVHLQLFVSIEMTRQNNTRLGQSVDRTLTLATNTVTIGLALQSALSRQKRVLEAVQHTREFIGNLLASNAASIRQHTADIGELYKGPLVSIEKLTQAHNDLIEAINLVDRLKTEGIEAARSNIIELNKLSSDLRQRTQMLPELKQAPSLEA